jgi:DNA-binding MarR family transcriptional regulator/predicted N-acetyltransferase YhbS
MSADTDRVASVRAFNRFYTRRIGVLGEGFLRTRHSLTEGRVLFELAQRDVTDVADLRRALELDAGHLSRLLARLERQGLVARDRSPADARRQRARLTKHGAEAAADLDRRSAHEIGALLDDIDDEEQRRLVAAMDTISDVLDEASTPPAAFVLRPPRPGDLGWILERHGVRYAEEYGWGPGFEALVARVLADYAEHADPDREATWIAELDGERVGAIMCVRRTDTVAQLRLLLVEPPARGRGLGGRLVDECLRFAKAAGYEEIVLWTQNVLVDARRIYERAGFTLVEEAPWTSYGPPLLEQTWSRRL